MHYRLQKSGIGNMRHKKLPDEATKHQVGDCEAVTIPAEGFEKLILFTSPDGTWIHKNYRVPAKKSRKNRRKRG